LITADQISTQLRLVFYDGEDLLTGEPVFRTKSFNNVKTGASAEQLYAVANALQSLQERPLHGIERRDQSEIREN